MALGKWRRTHLQHLGFLLPIMAMLLRGEVSRAQSIVIQPETSPTLIAGCVDQFGFPVPFCPLTLSIGFYSMTGGHNHESLPHPVSTPNPSSGITDANGNLPFTWNATRVGQIEFIDVCADLCSRTDVAIAYTPLFQLPPFAFYVFIGATTIHPVNHWATSGMINAIQLVTQQYDTEFSLDPAYQIVGANDISIVLGGIFDLNGNWSPPHASRAHDSGQAIDFRANGGPNSVITTPEVLARFVQICQANGLANSFLEDAGTANQHIHCAVF